MTTHNTHPYALIIFVKTRTGKEFCAKDYAPQRWIKSVGRDGKLTYTRDPRKARQFKTEAAANKVCQRYEHSMTIEMSLDRLRVSSLSPDYGTTYFGYYDGTTDTNYDLFTSQPVEYPADYLRMCEIMGCTP